MTIDDKEIEKLAIQHRNKIYASPRYEAGDIGDWLDGVEDDYTAGFKDCQKIYAKKLIELQLELEEIKEENWHRAVEKDLNN